MKNKISINTIVAHDIHEKMAYEYGKIMRGELGLSLLTLKNYFIHKNNMIYEDMPEQAEE